MIKFIEDKELCIKLKEKGFDEGCLAKYRGQDFQPVCQMYADFRYDKNSDIGDETNYWLACPTYSQVTDWLDEKHNFNIWIDCSKNRKWIWTINFINDGDYIQSDDDNKYFDSKKEALYDAITEALKLI